MNSTINVITGFEEDKPFVQIGEKKFFGYRRFLNMKDLLKATELLERIETKVCANIVEARQTLPVKGYAAAYKKEYNKAIYELLRCNQSKFMKLVRGKMFEAFIKPIPEDIRMKFCFGATGNLHMVRVKRVMLSLSLINQTRDDNLEHLIPLIMVFQRSPAEIKKLVGSSTWKRLCKNTVSRNKALMIYLEGITPHQEIEHRASVLSKILDIPTTLLNFSIDPEIALYLKNNFKGKWSKLGELHREIDMFRDTKRLSHNMFDKMYLWSPRRVAEEHEKLVRKAYASKYSATTFKWADQLSIGAFCYGGYEVTPLLNAADIGMEGSAMSHCVGGYANLSADGEYLVFSVKKDGMRYSTIGMHMGLNKQMHVSFNQQYKRYNERLLPEDIANEIPKFIEEMIN